MSRLFVLLQEGFHIRDTVCIRYLNENFIISGGEDTTLRLSEIIPETRICKPVTIIRSHISSIRAITFVKVDDFILAVSAGGRAQLKVWKLITFEGMILCKYHHEAFDIAKYTLPFLHPLSYEHPYFEAI